VRYYGVIISAGGEYEKMKDRLKKLRQALGLTQTEFADRIGSVQNTITGYESGRRNPSNPVISSICKEFHANEEWLRTGEGEMFLPAPSGELDALATKYNLSHRDYLFIEKLLKNPDAREAIESFCLEYAKALIDSSEDSETSEYDIPDTPEEFEAKYPPVDAPDERLG
jgi:transcriptional regulator with XRE-family HTH domain